MAFETWQQLEPLEVESTTQVYSLTINPDGGDSYLRWIKRTTLTIRAPFPVLTDEEYRGFIGLHFETAVEGAFVSVGVLDAGGSGSYRTIYWPASPTSPLNGTGDRQFASETISVPAADWPGGEVVFTWESLLSWDDPPEPPEQDPPAVTIDDFVMRVYADVQSTIVPPDPGGGDEPGVIAVGSQRSGRRRITRQVRGAVGPTATVSAPLPPPDIGIG